MTKQKISIITCTFNSEKYLDQCISSVARQTYGNVEHVFVDGQSTDKTVSIIKKYYQQPILKVEAPLGIYNALNHGLALATGDIVGLLHSDDLFYDENCLARIADSFENDDQLAYYCAKMIIYDKQLVKPYAILGSAPHKQTLRDQLYSSTYFAHPTYYLRKETLAVLGGYDETYRIAADIDWLFRLERLNLKFYFDDKPLIKFRASGESAKKYFFALKEEFTIRRKLEGISTALLLVYAYHFFRRSVRFILEALGLGKTVAFSRKLLLKIRT